MPAQRRSSTVLGVESSCDETSAAVVQADLTDAAAPATAAHRDGLGMVLSNVVWGQASLHDAYGGVVPEIAARAHVERLDRAILAALDASGLELEALDAVAATAGPGLIGGVAAGLATAQGFALGAGLPLLAINHLEGHALSPRLACGTAYPYLLLLVSGGHCQLLAVRGLGDYTRLGGSIDDSPGEAFDKLARHLGLGFPGGPAVERRAQNGDPARFDLPRPLLNRPGADMSFSGLKTAARIEADRLVGAQRGLRERDVDDLCAAFQAAVCQTLVAKTARAADLMRARGDHPTALAVAGGVAANKTLRAGLDALGASIELPLAAPPLSLCTDNAAMIAWAGIERLAAGEGDALEAAFARPRWPLDPHASPLLGSGRKGAKA